MVIHVLGMTIKVESYEFTHNGMKAVIWDTPGLCDRMYLDQGSILRDISMVYSNIDLFLLCVNAENLRVMSRGSLCQMIQCLECKFSKDMWKKTLVVLMRADGYVASLRTQKVKDMQSQFDQFKKSWEVILKEKLGSLFLGVAAAGHNNRPKLLETDKDSWITTLWEKCISSLPKPKRAALLKINEDRQPNCVHQ